MSNPGEYGSILDRDQPRPIKIKPSSENANSDIILIIVTAILLVGFFSWMSYGVATGISISQNRKSQVGYVCAPGQCALDTTTGEKICPEDGNLTIPYNIQTQVCTDPILCTNNIYGYAILPDGSTNALGICMNGERCRCSDRNRCPRYISSIFSTIKGNPYAGVSFTQTTFTQQVAQLDPGQTDGYAYSNGSFCSIPYQWLFRSSPGCATVLPSESGADVDPISSVTLCIDSNPCVSGTLAYISSDSSSFTKEDLTTLPLSCVKGTKCPQTEDDGYYNVPIFDTGYNKLVCRRIQIS